MPDSGSGVYVRAALRGRRAQRRLVGLDHPTQALHLAEHERHEIALFDGRAAAALLFAEVLRGALEGREGVLHVVRELRREGARCKPPRGTERTARPPRWRAPPSSES